VISRLNAIECGNAVTCHVLGGAIAGPTDNKC
jgi:hypothetical protein